MSEQEQLQRKCAFCDAQLFMLDGEGQNRRMFGVHDERACEIAALQSKLEAWERSAQEGHPNPCTLGPLCPYCEIERLSSKLDKAVEDVQRWKDEAANWKSEALADTAYRAELRKEVTALRRRLEIEPDADGHCRRCGLEWPDESETTEPHECPPGFMF